MNVKFEWIGWMKDGTHDKVWGYFEVNDKFYCFWGRRGKALSFKDHGIYEGSLSKLVTQKEKKGYKEVDAFQMFAIFPYFNEEVEKRLSFCILANKIK